jgi:hypothetical protein
MRDHTSAEYIKGREDMNNYRLAIDGDPLEKRCWHLFIQEQFPGYEAFWQTHIVPLTNRPDNWHFKTDQELKQIGKTDRDICIAQLHYTVLVHLHRAFEMLQSRDAVQRDELTEGIVRLSSALDVADELLERRCNPTTYDPWKDRDGGGREARSSWRSRLGNRTQPVREYRNHLVHGRISPSIAGLYPVIGRESDYFDWRKVTDPQEFRSLNPAHVRDHFRDPRVILASAWEATLSYLRDMWDEHLLAPKGP